MKKDATGKTSNFTFRVDDVTRKGDSLKLRLEISWKGKDAPVKKILFRKVDGTELKAKGNLKSSYMMNDDFKGIYEYVVPSGEKELNVILVKKAGEEVLVPLDMKVGLGGPVK